MKKLKWNRKLSILVLIMFVTVSFASFNTNLFIDGKAYVRVDKDIRITNIRLLESEYNGYENTSSEYTNRTISTDVSLPRQASSVTYEVTISNVSDRRYKITDIIEDSYDNKDVKYELIDASIGNIVEPHTEKTFKVKFTNNVTVVEEDDVYQTLSYTFDYTGGEQEFVVPYDGTYKIELWGAQGGSGTYKSVDYPGGYGGYTSGTVNLKKNTRLKVYVGQSGSTITSKGLTSQAFNGGGAGSTSDGLFASGGGGATDIRIDKRLNSRIMVAGGGGGSAAYAGLSSAGGAGGGLIGYNGNHTDSTANGKGGTQLKLGASGTRNSNSYEGGGFGEGSSSNSKRSALIHSGGGGGGYYGGGAGGGAGGSGGGGSSFISGHKGCIAITSSQSLTPRKDSNDQICTDSSDDITCSYHFFSDYVFTDTKIIDGKGYEWTTEVGTEVVGMPTHDGSSTMTGNEGNGYAKITLTRKIEDGSEYDFDYTGGEQTFTAPYSGTYRLETWGAQGGKIIHNDTVLDGGYGGYSTGLITLVKNSKLYVNNGGQGVVALGKKERTATSYNGGGAGFNNSGERYISGGGGATHIALSSGLLSEFENNKDNILIVSGGGGGIWFYPDARGYYYTKQVGHAGGYIGNTGIGHHAQGGDYEAIGGTQTAGYAFGQGQTAPASEKSGGGGGYYGGKSNTFSGGGGSGYIGNSLLTDKIMYCYTCQESQDINTRTVSTNSHSQTPKQNVAKEGDGYSRITLIKRTVNQTKLTLDFTFEEYVNGNEYLFGYTGSEQVFNVPKTGIYKLEVWGAQGKTNDYCSSNNCIGGYGGYSVGNVKLYKGTTLYLTVGEYGRNKKQAFGGGGYADLGGGGASHIAYKSGTLASLENSLDDILIVAGGGGGNDTSNSINPSGGGFRGTNGFYSSEVLGGWQEQHSTTNDYSGLFGQGGTAAYVDRETYLDYGGAGGGGFYGGDGSPGGSGSGGGGSGYIANPSLNDKSMYCYNCTESDADSTKTISTENHSVDPISNYAKEDNGYAKITCIEETTDYIFDYTGDVQEFVAPYKGIYKVELWGAQGGDNTSSKMGGKGGYTSGNVSLSKGTKLYVYVGEHKTIRNNPSFNGALNSTNDGASAGGATDVRLVSSENWYDFDSLKTRIMVAGGGGATSDSASYPGGDAGGLVGYRTIGSSGQCSYPGTQISPGTENCWGNYQPGNFSNGSFGLGSRYGASGGSGWFGGAGGYNKFGGGSGGSSFISGHPGCVSITENSTEDNISFVNDSNGIACNDSTSAYYNSDGFNMDSSCNKHYSGKVFTDTVMIDGAGYSWDENGKGDSVVGMPSHDGRTTMIGNVGNGYAKITLLEKIDTYNINYDLDGGTLNNKKKTYSTFDDDITLGTPTKKGYKFDGWTGGKNLVKESGNIWYDGPSKKFYSGNSKAHSIIIEVKPNTTYTISKKYAGNRFVVALSSEPIANQVSYSRIFVKNDENLTQFTFTTGENERYLMFGYHREDDENGDLETALAEIQIEEGNVATTYEEPILTPTMNISIQKGSEGNRTYTANWKEYVSVTIIYDACIEDRDNNRRYLDYIDTVDFIEYEYLPSLTTQEYLARNSDYYMYIGDVWGITNRLTILNELFEAGANIVTTGNDTTAQRVPFGVTDYHSTEDETITKKVSNEFTSQFKDSYSTGTDSKHFFTTSNTEVWYSVTVDDIEYDYMGRYTGAKGNKWIWSSGVFFPEYAMFPAVLRYDKYGN